MHWLPAQTILFEQSRIAVAFAANWLWQSTLLLAAGLFVGRLLRRRGAAQQSLVYRTTLVAALACPLATRVLSVCGVPGWSLEMPPAFAYTPAETAPETTTGAAGSKLVPATPMIRFESVMPTHDGRTAATSTLIDRPSGAGIPRGDVSSRLISVAPGEPTIRFVFDPKDAPQSKTAGTPAAGTGGLQVRQFGWTACVLALMWLLISGRLLARLAVAWSRLNRVRQSARPAEWATMDLCRNLCARLAVAVPDVLLTPFLPSPCLAGLRRPAVLLPEAGLCLATRDVLTHELAHLLRHDCYWNLVRRVATAVFFFQPLLWWLSRELEMAAEEVCDDFVVQYGGDRAEYANRLVDVAELSSVPMASAGVAIVSLRSMLAVRVARIMDSSRSLSTRASRLLVALALTGGFVGTAVIGLLGAAPPRSASESRSTEQELAAPSTQGNAQAADPAAAPRTQSVNQKLPALYERVAPAVVRVDSWGENGGFGVTGVIVTDDGYVVCKEPPAGLKLTKLTFVLSDGRRVNGKWLGRSTEWGIAVGKIDARGPWPHAELAEPASLKAGQQIVTIAYPMEPEELVRRPLLDRQFVQNLAPGFWFQVSGRALHTWQRFGVAFDRNGRLVGVQSVFPFGLEPIFTDAQMIRTLWDQLAAGKDLDQVRLGAGNARRDGHSAKSSLVKKEIPQAVMEKCRAATVRIRNPLRKADTFWSGAVVTADGFVATCGHHSQMSGTKVLVEFPNGRVAEGKVLGINLTADVGLVKITDPGSYPHVEMGDSTQLQPGDPCVAAGYGGLDPQVREPRVRITAVAEPPQGAWLGDIFTATRTTELIGGDSGGGLFDANGRLVAIHYHGDVAVDGGPHLDVHRRVELLRRHWEELGRPIEHADAQSADVSEQRLEPSREVGRRSIVEVLDAGNPVALGTVVGTNGLVLTKASVLPVQPTCRLHDGRLLPATVVATDRSSDLVVLTIGASGLAPIEWSTKGDLPVGTEVAIAGTSNARSGGMASLPKFSFPPEQGWLRVQLKDSPRGLEVLELRKMFMDPDPMYMTLEHQRLQKSDIVLSIDNHPTPDLKSYTILLEPGKGGAPIAVAGDHVHVTVRRGDKQIVIREQLSPPSWPRLAMQSPRSSGLADVYSVCTSSDSNLCGGPVFDKTGRAVGIGIAWRQAGWLLVLSAERAQAVTAAQTSRP
jgi:S1-C subfamily serine protease